MPAGTSPRYHALDSLRASMMLLGIYLHATVAYSTDGGWPYKQANLTSALNITLGIIHLFRMPVFYVMAGFFGALLYERRGMRQFALNRAKRILVPFAVAWLVLFPLVTFLAGMGRAGLDRTLQLFASGGFLRYAHPMHLWFLEYLVLLLVLAVVAVKVAPAVAPAGVLGGANRLFRRAVASRFAPLLLAAPSTVALLPMRYAGLEDPPSFVPVPRILLPYALVMGFGWLLYLNSDLLDVFRKRPWINTLLTAVPVAVYMAVERSGIPGSVSFYALRALHSIALWLAIYGLIGLFLRYLSAPSPRMRYLSDASYFLYLAHMPVIIVLQLALGHVDWSPLVKIPVVLAIAVPILLAMYHYGVRPTFLGAALNGRRYPIGRSAVAAAAA